MILLTTSRRPTPRIRTLCHDLARSIPNVVRINRGKLNLDGIAEKALDFNADHVIIVDRWRGGPGKIEFFKTEPQGLTRVPPLMYVTGIRLQREFEKKTKPTRALVITTPLESSSHVIRIAQHLSNFFNIPILSMDEAVLKHDVSMHISVNSSNRIQITFMFLSETIEFGPRITLSRMEWKSENEG